jgi:hypothetical protein
MDRYFHDESICGIEGASAPNAVRCARFRELDSRQLSVIISPDGGEGPRTFLLLE